MSTISWDSACSVSPAESYRQYAKRQHDAGQSYAAIGRELGTTRMSVRMALRPSEWRGTPEECPPTPQPEESGIETSVFLSDLHIPSHDRAAVNVVLKFIDWLKPDHVHIVGDAFDCYQLSKYDKDPRRALDIQEDLDELEDVLKKMRRAAGQGANIVYHEGNHEARLTKYLLRHPELAGLRGLKPENLFRLEDHNIRWCPQEETYTHHGFVITHGSCVRRHSGQSAMGEYEKYGCSGISGHSHRLGTYLRTTLNGVYSWTELGCLAELRPEYVIGVPNWQQGFAMGYFVKNSQRFHIETIPIVEHKFIYQARVFE